MFSTDHTALLRSVLSALLLALTFCFAGAMNHDPDLVESDVVMDSLVKWKKPLYQDQKPAVNGKYEEGSGPYAGLTVRYMKNRRAMVGDSCTVNRLTAVVSVGAWDKDKGNLFNEDLDDYAQFNRVIGAGVTVDPVVSVRDMRGYYAKGTEAGFAIVAGSGNAVLTLDIVKAYAIGFYRNGELLGSKALQEGQGGEGIALKLIQIPGSDQAVIMFTAVSDWVFDEIQLDRSGGVQVSVGDLLSVKYAFAGKARRFYIGTDSDEVGDGIEAYRKYTDRPNITFPALKGWNPVLLGIPFPFVSREAAKMCDGDADTGATITPILAAGYQGGAKFTVSDPTDSSEIFPAGTEVGWEYVYGSGLSLDVGSWIRMILFDRDGNKVQEETISADVLGLSVAKGGNGTTSITAAQPFSGCEIRFHTVLAVDLGAIVVYNAFVSLKPDASHHCPIKPTLDTMLCPSQNSMQLRSNPDISVTWSLDECPTDWPADKPMVSVTESGYVTNMWAAGDYVFKAQAADGCEDYVTITVDGFGKCRDARCSEFLDGTTRPLVLSDQIYGDGLETGGALISISNIKDSENILTGGMDEAATYTGGLSLASNVMVVGVKSTESDPTQPDYYLYDAEDPQDAIDYPEGITVGFVIENDVTGLDLSLLQFLQIRCYDHGTEVYRSVITESNGVDLGLAGSDDARKVRYSIHVPSTYKGNHVRFNEFQLWNSGVLNLNGGHIYIYYAFTEDTSADCLNPLGGETIVLGPDTYTTINADETQVVGVASVATVYDNITHLVDGKTDTYFAVANTINAGGLTVAINLGRTLDYRHELGIITDNKTYVASIGLGDWLKVKTYYHGVETGEEFTDWEVLGADVAGYGDQNFLFCHPQSPYDEVRITIGGVARVLDVQKYYGFFVRGDIDNDGIPDCEDNESCTVSIEPPTVTSVCCGDEIVVTAKGTVDTQYSVYFSEPTTDGTQRRYTVNSGATGDILVSYTTERAGYYSMTFYDGSGTPIYSEPYSVHPLRSEWKRDASNSDWNKWDNWSDGTPYCCTDVVIPTAAAHYPVLDGSIGDSGDNYCARGVHFEPESRVEAVNRLNYERAWVEASLMPNRYHLLSSPLRETYTGDWFAPTEALPPYFTVLDATTAEENRFNPTIFQRRWSHAERDRLWGAGTAAVAIDATGWSGDFNVLNESFPLALGYSLWVDNGTLPEDEPVLFRLPKVHTRYNYFSDYDQRPISGVYEDLTRDGEATGRFAFEEAASSTTPVSFVYDEYTRRVYDGLATHIELASDVATRTFLFGNPFMSDIDVLTFLADNASVVSGVGFYDGNAVTKVVYEPSSGTLVATVDDSAVAQYPTVIAPLQGVYLYAATEGTSVLLDLNEDQICSREAASPTPAPRREAKRDVSETPKARSLSVMVAAEEEGLVSGIVMCEGLASQPVLVENEVSPRLLVGALNGDSLEDVMGMAQSVPLAVVTDTQRPLMMKFHRTGGFPWEEYYVRDVKTGETYSLEDDIDLGVQESSFGRYVLQKDVMTGIDSAESRSGLMAEGSREDLKVTCPGRELAWLEAYDTDGRVLVSLRKGASEYHLSLPTGVTLLKGSDLQGNTLTLKLYLR